MTEMNEALTTKGIVDEQTYDLNATAIAPNPVPVPPPAARPAPQAPPIKMEDGTEIPARFVRIRVPATVTDQEVHVATTYGFASLDNAAQGVVTIIFPHIDQKADGTITQSLAKMEVLTLNGKDIERILKVAEVITTSNVEVLRAKQDPINQIAIEKNAETHKDNIVRDATAKAEGKSGGIIITGG